ncbi:hypothetical protein F5887DRAFT_517186 [Amanita rubescens]|nr:hypothetical protein F5887DRAFT_517186 [Amanita rubescens]
MKEEYVGDTHWKLKHLPGNEATQKKFTDVLVPRARKLVGNLEPWETLKHNHIQPLLDEVYGIGVYCCGQQCMVSIN